MHVATTKVQTAAVRISMEVTASATSLLLSFLLVSLSFFLFLLLLSKHRDKSNSPPGSPGWPFIGEHFSLFRDQDKFVRERMARHHPHHVFKTSILSQPLFFFCGPSANRFLFSNENKLLVAWWPITLQKLAPLSLFNTVGHKAKRTRRLLTTFLSPEALHRYVGLMDAIARRHMEEEWEAKEKVKAFHLIRSYTFGLASRLLMGIEDPDQMSRLLAEFKVVAAGMFVLPLNFPGTRFYRAMRTAERIREELRLLIGSKKRSDVPLKENRKEVGMDLLSCLLGGEEEKMEEREVLDNLLMLVSAGYDTTATALAMVMKYLAERPLIYANVLKEHKEIVMSKGTGELLDMEDIKKMKYSSNVVNETLRISPPAQGSFRKAIVDFTFEGFDIPNGSKMIWSAASTHKNPEYFPEPEKFDPSRFEGDGPPPHTFVPFGGGPRICPGKDFAKLLILVFLHNVVKRFQWELECPNEKIVIDPLPAPTLGLPLCLHPHLNS